MLNSLDVIVITFTHIIGLITWAHGYIFSKIKIPFLTPLTFNSNDVKKCPHQKHLGIILDSKLDFNIHVVNKTKKSYKITGIIKRLSVSVPRKALLTI